MKKMVSLCCASQLTSPSVSFFSRNPRLLSRTVACGSDSEAYRNRPEGGGYGSVRLEETVEGNSGKLRLDSWISSRISGFSRARVQASIRSGLVSVNGKVVEKASYGVKTGDKVNCTISELQPLRAVPEDIPLDIVYEDEHVLVVNKPAHMVVHPAPGNTTGTLVNGILHHCSLPTAGFCGNDSVILSETEDFSSDEEGLCYSSSEASFRPGIVHRLDKGTSGLLVVAKDEHSHAHLAEQFKQHTIKRVYVSLTTGVPSPLSGRIDIPIGRDPNNRIRMAAIPGPISRGHARHAASRYKVIEVLAAGGSALVEWRLETGRTHQIRAHAKYIGNPLLGDEVYGGTKNMALSLLQQKTPLSSHSRVSLLLSGMDRPCLHALALGLDHFGLPILLLPSKLLSDYRILTSARFPARFLHPDTGEKVQFSCPPPSDFSRILTHLREMGSQKVK